MFGGFLALTSLQISGIPSLRRLGWITFGAMSFGLPVGISVT